ncbi:MAG: hypothetical protein JNM96_05230, partial [Bacteroidia bacterium]|nr:hypothetical protein [Bacteroidia bacterium]
INLNNYETFVIDYFDGNLNGEEVHELKTFLLMHPELDINLDEEPVLLENETVNYEGKQKLKANFNDDLVIGLLEGTLNKEEKNIAENLLLNNTLFKKELNLYKHTIATPDTQIVFDNKELLKRKGKTVVLSTAFYMRIAAAVLFIAGLWMLTGKLLTNNKTITPEIAKVENTKIANPQNNTTAKENNSKLIEPVQENNNIVATSKSKKETTTEVKTNTPDVITNEQEPEKLYATNNATTNTVQEIKVTEVANNTLNKTNTETVKPKYMIEVVEEEDELIASNNKPQKGKLWNLATKALNKLNKKGVDKVNASEENNQLFIGALTISKVD